MKSDRIESYVLIKRLAIGGMGEIFLAEKQGALGVEKRVVIKRILPDLAMDQQFTRSFEDEARVAMQLNHSNIVQVFDFGQDNGQLYLVSEYVEGADLGQVLTILKNQGRKLPISLALGVLIRMSAALSYAHKKKDRNNNPLRIVHRDVNPSNVLISFNGDVKLTDFGIAKFEARKARTLPNQIKGKVMYLAPEMIAGHGVDHRADIFSLGSMAYEILCGEHPFSGKNEGEIIDRIRHSKHIRLEEKAPELPVTLAKIVENCLERDPDRRYQDMDDLQKDLTDYLFASHTVMSDSDIGKFLVKLLDKGSVAPQKVKSNNPRTITVVNKRDHRRLKLFFATGFAGVLAILAGLYTFWPEQHRVVMPSDMMIRMPVVTIQSLGRRGTSALSQMAEPVKIVDKKPEIPVRKKIHVTIRQPSRPLSQVIFRFFPARASVLIDGQDVVADGNNIITQKVTAGRHHILVLDTVSGKRRLVDFSIGPDKKLNLGTLSVTGKSVTGNE